VADRYAVIGHPVAHSRSPDIHAAFARQTGEDIEYVRLLAPLDAFAATVESFRAGGGRGANVTLPFKEEAFRLAAASSHRARSAGAVNTLRFDADGMHGDNTDGIGLVRDIRDRLGCLLAGARVLLLGAGGAARGVVLPILQEGPARFVIANRTKERALSLAAGFGAPVEGAGLEDVSEPFDVVINATSASIAGEPVALPRGTYAEGALAYDMMYGRQDTPFMAAARNQGAHVADGLGMLVEQAAESFFVWRGVRPQTRPVLEKLRGA
jgi:shikimate dehydrogenase